MCANGCFNDCDCTAITSTQGTVGDSATITIGTVTTGAPGSSVTFTNVGTPTWTVFDISIPQGATGAAGADGAQGASGVSALQVLDANTATVSLNGTTDSGTQVYLNRAAGVIVTLPSNPAIGTYYDFIVKTDVSSNLYLIQTYGAVGNIDGFLFAKKSATNDAIYTAAALAPLDNAVSMNGSTKGGLVGTNFRVVYAGTNVWQITGQVYASGAVATPFAHI